MAQRQRGFLTRAVTVALATGFALTIGLSRVRLGLHRLTVVLVAWTVGLVWLAAVVTAHRLFLTVRQRRTGPVMG
ncbi:hypothetical protein [Krasilnikovia cinnamomea]|uniref:hypothetical protein n=1 Tax=Krasilnikovia cinnamomea TaxID=349313 RepID=UPI00102D1C0C|nr:hypothetical protein [Krasilnikovia cinnamomea]